MRAVIQRVHEARVEVDGQTVASIAKGLLVYLGIHSKDVSKDTDWVMQKIFQARIFPDLSGRMNKSVEEVQGELLVVSQITLYGDLSKGNRPDMTGSMRPGDAKAFYEDFMKKIRERSSLNIQEGIFAASMKVYSINDGPITLLIDSITKTS